MPVAPLASRLKRPADNAKSGVPFESETTQFISLAVLGGFVFIGVKQNMHYVIGSGPAGVACAKALLARGAQVVMLDAGLELEPARAQIVCRLAARAPAKWAAADLAAVRSAVVASAGGLSTKLSFGSNFPYAEAEEKIPWTGNGVGLHPSLALGGFSNVWGAAMLPYRDEDMDGWPVKNAELARHYRAVLEFTGLAAQRDELEEWFP